MYQVYVTKGLYDMTETFKTAKERRAELVRGSILDPLNHPSYTPKEVQKLRDNQAAYEAGVAALKIKYDIP